MVLTICDVGCSPCAHAGANHVCMLGMCGANMLGMCGANHVCMLGMCGDNRVCKLGCVVLTRCAGNGRERSCVPFQ